MDKITLGIKLKSIRKSQGISLQNIAVNVGKTKSYISMIENSKAVPSLSTLRDIASYLGVTIADFFDNGSSVEESSHKETFDFNEDAKVIHSKKDEYNLFLLIQNPKFKMKTYIVELLPYGGYSQELKHTGQEQGYILSGTVRLFLDNAEHVLTAGDYFYFYSDTKHKVKNFNNSTARIYWIYLPE